ncbi:MAG: hypothetical protein NVS1B13_12280 [Flavisolibacter sp.]
MDTLIGGTILLAFLHAFIPNHWLPIIAVARIEGWNKKALITITLLSALAHVLGTVLLGLVLGLIGKQLEDKYGQAINVAFSVLLILFGLIYYSVPFSHQHGKEDNHRQPISNKRKWVFLFVAMMFFSPCLEVETLFLSAGSYGIVSVVVLSILYSAVSIVGILLLVLLGSRGINFLNTKFIEQNEKRISGIVLIFVGLLNFFIH